MITAMTGSRSPIRFVPHHDAFGHTFEDMARRVPDISKLQRSTGYRPSVELDEMLERVIEYWRSQPRTEAATLPHMFWPDEVSQFVH
jgi:UDP-glucose 4-epimerase